MVNRKEMIDRSAGEFAVRLLCHEILTIAKSRVALDRLLQRATADTAHYLRHPALLTQMKQESTWQTGDRNAITLLKAQGLHVVGVEK